MKEGGASLLQTESTALEQQRIVELPLSGRNFLQLVRLIPNGSAQMAAGGQANRGAHRSVK
jgi:hypothetical protein